MCVQKDLFNLLAVPKPFVALIENTRVSYTTQTAPGETSHAVLLKGKLNESINKYQLLQGDTLKKKYLCYAH